MKKIKIMVDWNNSEVVTKEEFEARKAEALDSWINDADNWNDWLAGKYYLREVFDMTEEEKEKERAEYLAHVECRALEEVMEDLEWITLDIEDVTVIEN